ncbi:MAG TPA: hypothetical protein VK449_03335 [Anaerolineales bacterium]|nr:hypothetical protein [Anaerolineales bacterium]
MRQMLVDAHNKPGSADFALEEGERGAFIPESDRLLAAPLVPRRWGTLRFPDGAASEPVTRLIVPVPSGEFDEAGLARLLWGIVGTTDRGILLAGRVAGADDEMRTRRRLTTLAALLRRHRTDLIETAVAHSRSWPETLRGLCGVGDAVVCPTPARSAGAGPSRGNLADVVLSDIRRPVYLLDTLPVNLLEEPPRRGGLGVVLAWTAPLLIVIAFAGLQSEIVLQTPGSLQTILLVATVALELATLLVAQSMMSPWK